VFKWSVALVAVSAAAVAVYYLNHANDELRRHVEEKFARQYPHLKVTVRSASLIENEGIEVRGISVVEPGAEGPRAELAYFDEMLLVCRTTTYELMRHEPTVTEVRVRRPTFLATRRADGTWSTSRLLPFPEICAQAPKIVVEGCSFEFFDPLRNPTSTLVARDVHLEIVPQRRAAAPGQPADCHQVRGFMMGDHFQRIEFTGQIADGGRRWQFTGTADGVELCPELHAALPGPIADQLAVLKSLRTQSRLRFTVSRQPQRRPAFAFDLEGQLLRGRVEDPRLPYPLTDVYGNVRCTNDGIHITDLQARSGSMTLRVHDAWQQGFAADAPCFVDLQCERLVVDRRLLETLPGSWRAQAEDFFLTGVVNAKAKVGYNGRVWNPDIHLECVDTSLTYRGFPYRLDNGQGQVRLRNDRLDFQLTAYSGADQIAVDGAVENLRHEPGFSCRLRAERITIDQKLLAALPEAPRKVVGSLRPYGRFSLAADVRRKPGSAQPLERHIRIALDHCSIKYDKFPYPVHNISGAAELVGDAWEFRDLMGTNDTGQIRAFGRFGPRPEGSELELHFAGSNIALEDELRIALPANAQYLWTNLQPRGTFNLAADVRYRVATGQLQLGAGLMPVGDTVSIEPRFLPFRIEGLRGEITYQNGRVTLGRRPGGQLKGHHQDVNVALRGLCDLLPGGGWRLELDDFAVDRLRADRDLQTAVPHALNPWIRKFDPKDPVNISGRIQVIADADPGRPPRGQWDMSVTFNGTNFNPPTPLSNLNGQAHVAGSFEGKRFLARAELDLDSLTCRDVQLTRITGPVRIDNEQVLLGSWADKDRPPARPRPLTAVAYGGWLLGDGWVKLEATPRYGLQLTAGDLDLARIGREVIAGSQPLSGKLNAGVNLRGTAEGIQSLGGTGYLRLRDADLYRLPQMIALLNILSLKPPDKAAFTNSEADFRVEGDHIYFDRINFSGDAITLRGQGEANLNTDLAMTFYATVGRDELPLPLIPDLFRAASQQIMLIHVDGKLAHPNIRRDPFPAVNHALGNLQAGQQAPAGQRGALWAGSADRRSRPPLLGGLLGGWSPAQPALPLQSGPARPIVR
jgi:hypothetical protein